MLEVIFSSNFKRDFRRMVKRGYNPKDLEKVMDLLAHEKVLPKKYKDHGLNGNYMGDRECHIKPDWLLIYRIDKKYLILEMLKTGSHSDLFKK